MGKSTLKVKLLQQFLAMREEFLHTIFLDLLKAYDALDSSRCLDILEGYGVCPMALRLFLSYWDLLQMVARAGGGYGEILRGERGVMQGDPLLPTIFNVLVDVVVRQWESLVAERDGGDISNNDDAEQLAGRIIREINNRR